MADAGSGRIRSELIESQALNQRAMPAVEQAGRLFHGFGRSVRLRRQPRSERPHLPDRFKTLSNSLRRSLATGAVLTRS